MTTEQNLRLMRQHGGYLEDASVVIVVLSVIEARQLVLLLQDYQSMAATEAQRLGRIHHAPNAEALMLEAAEFCANIRERLTKETA